MNPLIKRILLTGIASPVRNMKYSTSSAYAPKNMV
jgi:hypothetical protein